MITYDFDKLTQRRHTHSVKWDEPEEGVLPMWVADMDFETAPAVVETLRKRVEHGIFGYTKVPDEFYGAITRWFSRRHGWLIDKEWILYTSGVVPAISAIIKALTQPGDAVLIHTPVYNCFFSSIRNNGCLLAENKLVYHDNSYTIDFDDFERQCAREDVKVFLLCNPHNPVGRVWTQAELQKMGNICIRHNVVILSDEIHCELTMPGYNYTPTGSISPEIQRNCITCVSPSKAFNIAGLQISAIVAEDAGLRAKIDKALNVNEVCDVNPFGVLALIAAYNEGEEWLDALRQYLYDNYTALCEYFHKHLPYIPITRLEGTYLVWADCRCLGPSDAITARLESEGKVMVNSGTMYGSPDADGFIRVNIACPRERMMEGLRRIHAVFSSMRQE